jgi:hypothetical protein
MRRLLLLVLLAGCDQEVTPGNELLGEWSIIGNPDDRWSFREDLTYVRSGPVASDVGQFFVEDGQLHLISQYGGSIAYDYLATRDHFLGLAQHAVGETTGRLGTWRGSSTDLDTEQTVELTTTLRADGGAHVTKRTITAAGEEILDGDGAWIDPNQANNIFIVSVTYPGGATEDRSFWHIDRAIGQLGLERITF